MSVTRQPRPRRKTTGYLLAGLLAAAVVAGAAMAIASGGDNSPTRASEDPFGPHYDGLEARRVAAVVPTMMETMRSSAHIHPQIAVYVGTDQIEVPPNIGIDPGQPGMQMADLHTHDASGTIHDEGMPSARLGQFFEIWGVPFSATQLGPYQTSGAKRVRMWVDGSPSEAFGDLPLADGQRIVVAYGTAEQAPA